MVSQAARYGHIQPGEDASGDETYNVGMEDDLADGMCGTGYQEIDPVLEVIVEILKRDMASEAAEGRRDTHRRSHLPRRSSVSNGYAFGRPPDSAFSQGHRVPHINLGLS